MDALPAPSEDIIDVGVQAVAQRAGTAPTVVRNMARQLLAEEGLGHSPAETWQAIGQIADYADEQPHTRSLADRAWEAGTEIDRLGRMASRILGGRRHG